MNYDQHDDHAPNTAIPLTWPSSDESFHESFYPPSSSCADSYHHVDLHQQPSSSSANGPFSSSPLAHTHLSSSTSASSLHCAEFDDISLAALSQASHAANNGYTPDINYKSQQSFAHFHAEPALSIYGKAMGPSLSHDGASKFRLYKSDDSPKRCVSGLTIKTAASAPELRESSSPAWSVSHQKDSAGVFCNDSCQA